MKIYTKTGDEGTTGLLGGERILKSDVRMDAIGTVDELNASLGWCAVANHDSGLASQFRWIQAGCLTLEPSLPCPPIVRIKSIESDPKRCPSWSPTLTGWMRSFRLCETSSCRAGVNWAPVCISRDRFAAAPSETLLRYMRNMQYHTMLARF